MANTGDADLADGIGRGRGRGSQLLIKQNPNDAGYVVWGDFYFDAVAGGGVDGTIATSQAQSSSLALDREIGATTETGQGQSVAATSARSIDTTAATSQGQSSQTTANGVLDGVIGSAQGQTVEAFADTAITVDATVSTSQAQSVDGLASSGIEAAQEQTTYHAKKKKQLGGHYWKPEELESVEPLVTRLPIPSEPEELPPIASKPRINRLDTFASAHSALAEIGIHYKQSPIDYSSVINALQAEIQQQQDDDMAIATLVAMLI